MMGRTNIAVRVQVEQNNETMRVTTREWAKAERKVPAGTTTGPDGIPMRLIKILGKNAVKTGDRLNNWKGRHTE